MNQHGDVLLYHTPDGGEIEMVNGLVTMSGGLETMAYLCLFGGNEEDDGRPGHDQLQAVGLLHRVLLRRLPGGQQDQGLLQDPGGGDH